MVTSKFLSNIKRIILILLGGYICIFCTSCHSRDIPKSIAEFINHKVIFPGSLMPVLNGRTAPNINLLNAEIKLVVWMDSTSCTPCALQHMDPWYDVTNFTNQFDQNVKVIFIISPKYKDRQNIKRSTMLFRYPMYIDSNYEFKTLNPNIPNDPRLHVFLLDFENKVTLIGNPIGNSALWNLYKQEIINQTKNNTFVPVATVPSL